MHNNQAVAQHYQHNTEFLLQCLKQREHQLKSVISVAEDVLCKMFDLDDKRTELIKLIGELDKTMRKGPRL